MQQVEASLKRLNLDYIDLYQIHSFDPLTPFEETLNTLDDLIRSGKVRYIGASNMTAWQLMKAVDYSHYNHKAKFVSMQSYYSLAGRDIERELISLLNDQKIGLMVWSPLAAGLLSGKYKRNGQAEAGGRLNNFASFPVDKERAFNIIEVLQPMAESKNATLAQLSLAWLLHQSAVTSVIIGANKMEQLDDNLKSVDIVFTHDELKTLDEVSKLPVEYPGWMRATSTR
jgi:aryl-alcohol dehydrogenase-like predicted oxidoreductase